MMKTPQSVTPRQAANMIQDGAVLLDIRPADEYRRRHISGAQLAPLDALPQAMPNAAGRKVIFHCRTGIRTTANAQRLAACVDGESYLLAGGLDAWQASGLPVIEDRRQPLDIMRQVQIVVGSLVILGVLLGTFVAPAFYGLSVLVGLGLLVAGITGFCGMARLLTWVNALFAPVAP